MEAADLFHDYDRGLVICLLHGSPLLPDTISNHLRNKHRVKGKTLHVVEEYIQNTRSSLVSLDTFVQLADYSVAISHIKVQTGFACSAPACSKQKDWISQNKHNVERHVSRFHQAQDRKRRSIRQATESTACTTVAVTFQSVFPQPYYSPFIITEITRQSSPSDTEGIIHTASSIFFHRLYREP